MENKSIKIAVIFGGKSEEHEVSRNSAVNVLKSLAKTDYNIIKIGITKKGQWFLTNANYNEISNGNWEKREDNKRAIIAPDPEIHGLIVFGNEKQVAFEKIDCVVPVLHGEHGEDGDIQGLFELAEIPYVGPGVKSSANCMDKSVTKELVKETEVAMASHAVVYKKDFYDDKEEEIVNALSANGGKYPLFVKPCEAGSSVGASKARTKEELEKAMEKAFEYDEKILVEEMIHGREMEVAVLGNRNPIATSVGEILSAGEFYDYDSKYNNPESRTKVVDDLPDSITDEIREAALKIYKRLDCRGLSRVDFFYSDDGKIVFNEVNTLPGFTNISMYPQLWQHMGIEQSVLIDSLIKLAIEEHS